MLHYLFSVNAYHSFLFLISDGGVKTGYRQVPQPGFCERRELDKQGPSGYYGIFKEDR